MDPILMADALYDRGYRDRQEERDYDPRGCSEWSVAAICMKSSQRLIRAILEAGKEAGIIDKELQGFSGPQCLMVLEDLVKLAKPVAQSANPYDIGTEATIEALKRGGVLDKDGNLTENFK